LTTPSDLTVPLMLMSNYSFPAIFDPDSVDNITITVKDSRGLFPTFMILSNTNLTIYPKLMSEVNTHQITVILDDSYNSKNY